MLPLTASAAVVVNAKVTGTRAFAATRSPAAMVNTTPVGCVEGRPETNMSTTLEALMAPLD